MPDPLIPPSPAAPVQTPPTTPVTTPPAATPEPPPAATPPVTPEAPKAPEAPKVEAPQPLTAEAVKLPEGFAVDEPVMGEFLGIMNDDKLSGAERAQKLVDLQANTLKSMSEKAVADWDKLQETWQGEVKADPTVGGDKLEANLGKISTLINTFGTPEVREIFSQTGAGNNVHMVKFLTKIAAALGEGTPTPAAVPAGGAKTLAQKMYPSMKV